MSSRLHSFFSYYGSKWQLAPEYPQPRHPLIVEPFAGSAQYATLYPDRDVILCDLNPVVCRTWRWLISATRDDVLSLPLLEPGQHIDELGLPEGPRDLIGWWLNSASTAPRNFLSKRAQGVKARYHWGPVVRARIADAVHRISHWQIIEGSYEDLDVPEAATYFVDPPYQGAAGRHYTHDAVDYEQLGRWCRSREGQVIVCEQAGADWLPFEPMAELCGSRHDGGDVRRTIEVMWSDPRVPTIIEALNDAFGRPG